MSGPLPRYLAPLTVPASRLYGWAVARRNARFDRGDGVQAIDRPVISVGNITTGGTGKTPMVMWIAQTLLDAGHRPAIAMRGYKARPGEFSDEQAEYLDRFPAGEVPVVAKPNRIAALRAFLPKHPQIDCIILDDGFQHRQLKRDLDLVLIDARANTFEMDLLPAGHLREPIVNLRRADAVIVTHAPSVVGVLRARRAEAMLQDVDSTDRTHLRSVNRALMELNVAVGDAANELARLKSQIAQFHGKPPVALTRHAWLDLSVFEREGQPRHVETGWLAGKRVVTMLGIGQPLSVLQELDRLGATVVRNIPAADHQRYDYGDLEPIDIAKELNKGDTPLARDLADGRGCDALIVTAKDWVKLRSLIDWSRWSLPVVVPRLAIEMFEGADVLRRMILSAVQQPAAGKPAG